MSFPSPVSPQTSLPSSAQIISRVTTTDRRTLPDGSIETKVVRKKRFLDGREESTETVHVTTSHQPSADHEIPDPTQVTGEPKKTNEVVASRKEKKNGGWFWRE